MGKFNEYTQKATPEDADSLMIYDAAAKSSKLSPFSGIWNWIVGKLTNAVISNLQTSNKSVIGALNELNSNRAFGTLITSEDNDCNNLGFGIFLLFNPKNGVTGINWHVVISANNNGAQTGFQIAYDLTDGSKTYIRKQASGIWSDWKKYDFGAINEAISNRLFDIYRNYSWKTSHSIDVSKANTLLMIAFGGSNGDQSIVLPLTKTGTDTWLYNAEYLATTNFAISCKSNVLTITNTATFLCFLVKVI